MARKKNPSEGNEALVILDSSEASRDLFYATGFPAGDPFPFFQVGWRKYMTQMRKWFSSNMSGTDIS